ncbi:unnamed protein product [Diabrotica balteata]|uniref:Regulatory protein zeste n=1 Tax=Diabrotica balteata TaxID=107213 RepID=A0A9N9TFY9_DIABA|nr:unnamed protein product [Diabrotica balteata]
MCQTWLADDAPININKIQLVYQVTRHSFLPADRVFGIIEKAIRRKTTIIQPQEYFDIFSEYTTVIKYPEFKVMDWKTEKIEILKGLPSWHFQISKSSRITILREKSLRGHKILVQGEMFYKSYTGTALSVTKKENKKTNAVTNQEKLKNWEKVAGEFNSVSLANIQRPIEVLKRFYENQKQELRKRCANKKMHIKGTGGDPPLPEINNPTEDLLLSIVNEKTVSGINIPFGGDVNSESEDEDEDMELEFVDTPEIGNQGPCTSTELSQDNIQKNKTWASYTPSDLAKKMSSPLKQKIANVLLNSQDENIPGPSTINKETPTKSSRRRPAVVVKSLTSSDIAAKFNKLLDCRLEIVAYEKKELEQRLQHNSTKHEK